MAGKKDGGAAEEVDTAAALRQLQALQKAHLTAGIASQPGIGLGIGLLAKAMVALLGGGVGIVEAKPRGRPVSEKTALDFQHAPEGKKTFAANLKRERLRAGLGQAELAERAGLSQSHVSQLENAKWGPRLDTVQALARALGCQAHDLLKM